MKNIVSWVLSLVMVGAGVALIASFFLRPATEDTATNTEDPKGFNVPQLKTAQQPPEGTDGPQDKTLKLTIPAMTRVKDATVPDAAGNDTDTLDENTAIHLQGTGFPWQDEANVYIAGHRLGYPNTASFLAFYDLNKLEDGDEIFVTDANGKQYTYKVFKESIVSPTNLEVTEAVPGKNILTLQSCTLPDYSERLIVKAELVKQA